MQSSVPGQANRALITYGSPLRRLYATAFPAYFNNLAFERLGTFLSGRYRPTPAGARPDPVMPAERRTWRWRNLYRPTDPIGGAIFADHRLAAAPTDRPPTPWPEDVDWWLPDPEAYPAPRGDTCPPPARAHSGYPDAGAYAEALDRICPVAGADGPPATVRLVYERRLSVVTRR